MTLPTRTCAGMPPPTYVIPRRIMPACTELPDPPGPAPRPPLLDVLIPEGPVLGFGCFLPGMTSELRVTDSTAALEHRVTSNEGDPCQFSMHTTLDLPPFVIDPIKHPPCGTFAADVSTTFGTYAQDSTGITPPARLPYATAEVANYAIGYRVVHAANSDTSFGARIKNAYAIIGSVSEKCDKYVLRCKAPGISFKYTWVPATFSGGSDSHGVIDTMCQSQQDLMMSLVGGSSGSDVAFFNWVKLNTLSVAMFEVFKVDGAGSRTKLGDSGLTAGDSVGAAEHNAWCNVALIPGLQVKIDAAVGDPNAECYAIALSAGDEFEVSICKDDSEPCNRHLSIDFTFPRILADPRIQSHTSLVGAVFAGNNNFFKVHRAVVKSRASGSGPIKPGETFYAEIYDDNGHVMS